MSTPLDPLADAPNPTDTPTGWDRAPDRYMASGRETVDRMRDLCRALVRDTLDAAGLDSFDPGDLSDALGDAIFAVACDTHALKYCDRRGLKDDAQVDAQKEAFWVSMAMHIRLDDVYPDPRHQREGFVPYSPMSVR